MDDMLSLIRSSKKNFNLTVPRLVEDALQKKEGILTSTGALLVMTGKYTGRSPKDKYIVRHGEAKRNVNFNENNQPMSRATFYSIKKQMIKYMKNKDVYVFDGFAGADKKYQRKFRIINEKASQNLFIHQLLIRPTNDELKNFGDADFTILVCPDYKCQYRKYGLNSEAVIAINFDDREAIICGSMYSGEIKKCVFTIMNYLMPLYDKVLPMHCSCNMSNENGETCVFFGLSGTGKTTLSTDPDRALIGDDEHGWSENSVFNFEGGCYAKTISLKKENEPDIYNAIRFGAVLENVDIDIKTRICDYDSNKYTENTRVGYPIQYINNSKVPGYGDIPKVVIFLTADAFGVLPPISRLDRDAAMYHFVTGFTSKVAGTERGITEPVPTFSTLFGEPFMPLSPKVYASMLGERLDTYGTKVYLVNTGWTGGPYGVGERMKLKYTRLMIKAALSGELNYVSYIHDALFNLDIPQNISGVPDNILNPRDTWKDKDEYDKTAINLDNMLKENFDTKYKDMPENIRLAGPFGR
ncbi:MAG: phosphoenolpyruvate carboxykinase (ATP) [Lachnospiraceae bacterium]|nr:phosphoenolpyruvate carboxykinase (ATP) [Lachnospiraceae bacterium]